MRSRSVSNAVTWSSSTVVVSVSVRKRLLQAVMDGDYTLGKGGVWVDCACVVYRCVSLC